MLGMVLDQEPFMSMVEVELLTLGGVMDAWTYEGTVKLLGLMFTLVLTFTWYHSSPFAHSFVDAFLLAPWRMKLAACTADSISIHHERDVEVSEESSHFFCCPKRRARYWKCAKRRSRCASAAKPNEDYPCPLAAFFKLHLPPPLPFMRRRRCHHQTPTLLTEESDETTETTPEVVPMDTPADGDVSDSTSLSSHDSAPPTCGASQSTASESKALSPAPPKANLRRTTAFPPPKQPPPPAHTAHLIDLTRMQQWQFLLDHPALLKRRSQAKYRDSDGLYPLHWAAAAGGGGSSAAAVVAVVQALLETYPTAARRPDAEGSMPLHFAAHYGATVESIQVLLRAYQPAAQHLDRHGRSPLYHATDQSASRSVLQVLVHADPDQITTPCYPRSTVSSRQQQHQRLLVRMKEGPKVTTPDPCSTGTRTMIPREMAIRTPLYLIWASALSDRLTRIQRRGKKWDKAVWMLQASYRHHHRCGGGGCRAEEEAAASHHHQWHSADQDDDDDETNGNLHCNHKMLAHATIAMDVYLPDPVLSLVIATYPETLRTLDSLGRLPLAAAVSRRSSCSSSSSSNAGHCNFSPVVRLEAVVADLLHADPAAARHRNVATGRSALMDAIVAGHVWWSTGSSVAAVHGGGGVLRRLLRAAPEALELKDGTTGLPPALLAAVPRNAPVVGRGESSSVTSVNDAMDPCHLLTSKQREKLWKVEVPPQQQHAIMDRPDETAPQLETIYELLRANPAQVGAASA